MKLKFEIKIHLLFYLFMVFSVITGYLKDFFLITLLIIIHEMGHITISQLFKWKIEEVKILPLGAITIFKEDINKPLKEEFLILFAGPCIQLMFFFLTKDLIDEPKYIFYNYLILGLNLLPIIPLDGSKLIWIITSYILPYKMSISIVSTISIITMFLGIIFLVLNPFNFMLWLLLFFICIENLKFNNTKELLFERFVWERYNKKYFFTKKSIIYSGNINKMKRDKTHLFYNKNRWLSEKEILSKRFDLKRKIW